MKIGNSDIESILSESLYHQYRSRFEYIRKILMTKCSDYKDFCFIEFEEGIDIIGYKNNGGICEDPSLFFEKDLSNMEKVISKIVNFWPDEQSCCINCSNFYKEHEIECCKENNYIQNINNINRDCCSKYMHKD